MSWWERAAIVGGVVLATLLVATFVDHALTRRLELPPEALTRYRVLRRTIIAAIVIVGVLSALLVIPAVRTIAGGILASSAVVGLVIGLAAQRTLANFVAGVLIAVTQPLRLGDQVEVLDTTGTVEEIRLSYTVLRTPDGARYFVPNDRLAADTIRNATIAGQEHLARVEIAVPAATDLDWVVAMLVEEARAAPDSLVEHSPQASVVDLETPGSATVSVEAWAPDASAAGRLAGHLRLAAQRRLRERGAYA